MASCTCNCGCSAQVGESSIGEKIFLKLSEGIDFEQQICDSCMGGIHQTPESNSDEGNSDTPEIGYAESVKISQEQNYREFMEEENYYNEENTANPKSEYNDDALTILDKRLARGEITLEEFTVTKKAVMGKEDIDDIEESKDIEDREILPEEKKLSEDLKKAYANFMHFMEETQTDYENRLRIYSKNEPDVVRLGKVIEYNKKRLDEIEKAIYENSDQDTKLAKQQSEIAEQQSEIARLEIENKRLYGNQMTLDNLQPLLLQERLRTWDLYNIEIKNDLFREIEEAKRNRGLFKSNKPLIVIFERMEDGRVKPVKFENKS